MKTVNSILIVDDNPSDVFVCEYMLKKSGLYRHVMSTSNGQNALEMFREYELSRARDPDSFPPVVVLLDINMPLMDGFGFLDGLNELNSPTPDVVVMLTSSNQTSDRERASSYSVVKDYVVKPLTLERAGELATRFGI